MEASYKRSMSCNYIILQEQEMESKNTYEIHMLLENQIQGLLPCKMQRINGQDCFYYEITGCQKLVNLFEKKKFQKTDITELFAAVVKTMECLDEYLLNRDFLLLDPMYVYKNMEDESYVFLWFPFAQDTIEKQLRKLTEYLLPKIDHNDKEAVEIGYGIYKESIETHMRMEVLKNRIYGERETEQKKDKAEVLEDDREAQEREKERQKILDDFYKEEEEENVVPYRLIASITGSILGIILLFLIWHFRLLPDKVIGFGIIILILAGLVLAGVGYVWKQKAGKTEKKQNIEESKMWVCEEETPDISEEIANRVVKEEYQGEGMTVVLGRESSKGAYLQEADEMEGKKHFLQKEISFIGKSRENADICLDVPTVSRIHAKIIHREEGDYLMDLNSRNGTLLNGEYLNPEVEYFLQDNSVVVFAQVKFRYFVGG